MRKPFLFKRGRHYHLEYFDKTEQRIKRTSTGETKKNDAIKFLMEFEKNRMNKKTVKFTSLSQFSKEYEQYVGANLSKGYLRNTKSIFKILIESIGDIPLKKINNRLIEQYITEVFKKSNHQARGHYDKRIRSPVKELALG